MNRHLVVLRLMYVFTVLAALTIVTAGRGNGAPPAPAAPVTPVPATAQRVSQSVTAAQGATLALANGLQITIPPGALSIDATVTLTAIDTSSVPVGTREMVPVGACGRLDLGSAQLVGSISVRAPRPTAVKAEHIQLAAITDGISVPLTTTVDPEHDMAMSICMPNCPITNTVSSASSIRDISSARPPISATAR
jgi:hypothetical protein